MILQKSNQIPLHFACSRASKRGFRVTQLLLKYWEEGRLVEDLQKCLPIHYAVQCGNIDTVKLLLEVYDSNQLLHVRCLFYIFQIFGNFHNFKTDL